MSEYQFYEFRSVDRSLTEKEQQEIARWSSRTFPTAAGATFVYHYSGFPKDPKQVVGKYFDAMFYIANWGTTRLMFRFPKELLDLESLQPYCTVDDISLSEHGEYVVLEMCFSEEEGYGWTEGEGYLSSLIGLRQDILRGDHRSLYLAWLYACAETRDWEEFDTEMRAPSLTCSLKPLNGALKTLVDVVNFDQDLLAAASISQADVNEENSADMTALISLLPEAEKDQFLCSLLHEEPLLSFKLHQRLLALSTTAGGEPANPTGRTIGEIFQEMDRVTEQRREAKRLKLEEKRRQKLLKIAAEEVTLWENVSQHISEKKSKSYDAAVLILKDLLLLAEYRGTETEYQQRVQALLKEYPRLSLLKAKITRAKLLRELR